VNEQQGGLPNAARSDHLILMANRWGIPDDYEREKAIAEATNDELVELAHCLDIVDDSLWAWLAGPESFSPEPSTEYVRMTALTMAVDSARVKLASRSAGD
jgi:hypothetical protein